MLLERARDDDVSVVRNGAVHAVLERLGLGKCAVQLEAAVGQRADDGLEQRERCVLQVPHVSLVVARVCTSYHKAIRVEGEDEGNRVIGAVREEGRREIDRPTYSSGRRRRRVAGECRIRAASGRTGPRRVAA